MIPTAFLAAMLAFNAPAPLDWKSFDNPAVMVLTAPFAKEITGLPESEKAVAIQRLQESLKSKEVEVRRRAALTLGELGDKSGVPVMIADLKTAEGRDRDNVIVAIRILKDDKAIPALREALRDKSPYIRSIAVAALGELKAVKAYDEIVAVTKDKESLGRICTPIAPAFSACYALGALGEKKVVPVLIELLQDKDLKFSAQQALESLTGQKLGDDAEKWNEWWGKQSTK